MIFNHDDKSSFKHSTKISLKSKHITSRMSLKSTTDPKSDTTCSTAISQPDKPIHHNQITPSLRNKISS